MDQKIIDWYSERHFQLHKMVQVGFQRGLTRPQVESAMVHCWKKIQDGKPIQDIDIAKYVFNVAKVVDATIYKKRLEIIVDLEQENAALKFYCGVFCLVALFLLII